MTAHGTTRRQSIVRHLGRTTLVMLGFTGLLFPLFGLVMPPDPFSQLFVLAVVLPLLLVAAVVYVQRGQSVRQIGRFLLAVFLLLIPLWIPYAALVVVLRLLGVPIGPLDVLGQVVLLVADYAGAYYLVYRGGYERLQSWLVRVV